MTLAGQVGRKKNFRMRGTLVCRVLAPPPLQNVSFNASRNCLAEGLWPAMVPSAVLVGALFGALRYGWFQDLQHPARNRSLSRSRMGKNWMAEKSHRAWPSACIPLKQLADVFVDGRKRTRSDLEVEKDALAEAEPAGSCCARRCR